MDNKIKILFCGDVNGQFDKLFKKADTINNKSGPFDLLLCVGNFFGVNNNELNSYKCGQKKISIPTYFLGPNNKDQHQYYESIENDEVCPNLNYLGKRGIYNTASKLKIAYLSGIESNDMKSESWQFTKEDVILVRNSSFAFHLTKDDYKGVDILLTSQWPFGISEKENNSSKLISWLVKEIKPRYHCVGLNGIAYEKLYRNSRAENTQLELATRFVSLSTVANLQKDRFIYAVSIAPIDNMRITDLIEKTTDEIDCPYNKIELPTIITAQQNIEKTSQFFYDMDNNSDNYSNRKRKFNSNNQNRHRHQIDQEKCWFCLSSQNVEKHLIITIGESFYLALAKGPLTKTHLLILPITHIQSASALTENDWLELNKYKEIIKKYYLEQFNEIVCFFERNYKTSHMQINAVGLSKKISFQLKDAFECIAAEYNLNLIELTKLNKPTQLPEGSPYFVAELPDDVTILTKQMRNFPLHFGREVLCSPNLLNDESNVDWRKCELTKEEEIEMVNNLRVKYKKYDFNI